MICGVDEAGKGSVLGPMIIAAVGCQDMKTLSDLGVADSKKLSRAKREELDSKIRDNHKISVITLTSEDIDRMREEMTMNEIVARAHAQAVDALNCSIAYLDACDVNAERYKHTIEGLIHSKCEIIASHKADDIYPVVSAASIIAKVERDRSIEMLSEKYGNIGSGYPSDHVTIEYIRKYIQEHKRAPPIARLSWETIRQLISSKDQSTLFDF